MDLPRTRRRTSSRSPASREKREEIKRTKTLNNELTSENGSSHLKNCITSSRRSRSPNLKIAVNAAQIAEASAVHENATGSTETSMENGDKKPAANKHNTRSQNGTRKQVTMNNVSGDVTENIDEDTSFDACSAFLASIDERAYSRDLLRDANAILEDVLFPMSFPWAHPNEPIVKTIPRDIDEMYGIISAGADLLANEFHGKVEKVRDHMLPGSIYAAARRSSDPGVIEHTEVSYPTVAQRASLLPRKRHDPEEGDVSVPGELSLRAFQEVQSRKRQRLGLEVSNKKCNMISVRIGSTSSRSRIFDLSPNVEQTPLLLPVLLPDEVQNGKRVKHAIAVSMATGLGSYDCRHGLAEPTSSDRRKVGRTRLIWSRKEGPPQKPFYRSLLNGEKLENRTHKRPKHVRLGIRVNGSLLTSADADSQRQLAAVQRWVSTGTIDESFAYDGKRVEDALERICGGGMAVAGIPQCSLDCEELATKVLEDHAKEPTRRTLEPFTIDSLGPRLTASLRVVPPKIDCLPAQDGILRTICSQPGSLNESLSCRISPNYVPGPCHGVGGQLLDKMSADLGSCAVCWSKASPDRILQCQGCNLRVHAACYGCGRRETEEVWKCHACSSDDLTSGARFQMSCAFCPCKGSSVSLYQGRWVHDVCRIWGPSTTVQDSTMCALCADKTKPAVRCAAKGCGVCFHPMCALVASKAAEEYRRRSGDTSFEDAASQDAFLCSQYQLSMIDTCFAVSGTSSLARTVPVVFCGIHNPDRQIDYYGLYPGGRYMDKVMDVPPRPEE